MWNPESRESEIQELGSGIQGMKSGIQEWNPESREWNPGMEPREWNPGLFTIYTNIPVFPNGK